jgi:Na+-transporting NADH:ubiquinone oxidoreductase, subunit NqrC
MNESVIKTIGVAFAVCLICSLIVSASAVSLRDKQKENKLNDKKIKILEVADIKIESDQTIGEAFNKLEQKYIDFNTDRING